MDTTFMVGMMAIVVITVLVMLHAVAITALHLQTILCGSPNAEESVEIIITMTSSLIIIASVLATGMFWYMSYWETPPRKLLVVLVTTISLSLAFGIIDISIGINKEGCNRKDGALYKLGFYGGIVLCVCLAIVATVISVLAFKASATKIVPGGSGLLALGGGSPVSSGGGKTVTFNINN
jgi:hypothetical protein